MITTMFTIRFSDLTEKELTASIVKCSLHMDENLPNLCFQLDNDTQEITVYACVEDQEYSDSYVMRYPFDGDDVSMDVEVFGEKRLQKRLTSLSEFYDDLLDTIAETYEDLVVLTEVTDAITFIEEQVEDDDEAWL